MSGTDPDNWFPLKCNSSRFDKAPTALGTVPLKLFSEMKSRSRIVEEVTALGTELLKSFSPISSHIISVQQPSASGMEPYQVRFGKIWFRAALKGTNLRGQTPICGFLRFPPKICRFLVSQMLRFPGKGKNQRKCARICENLRLGSVCPLRFVPLSAPWLIMGAHELEKTGLNPKSSKKVGQQSPWENWAFSGLIRAFSGLP